MTFAAQVDVETFAAEVTSAAIVAEMVLYTEDFRFPLDFDYVSQQTAGSD